MNKILTPIFKWRLIHRQIERSVIPFIIDEAARTLMWDETTVVVLNRNERHGKVIGLLRRILRSVCLKKEVKESRLDRTPEVVIGSRLALREQESHRQVVVIDQQRQAPPPVSREHARRI